MHSGAKRKIGKDAGRYTVPPDFNSRAGNGDNEPVTPISPWSIPNKAT